MQSKVNMMHTHTHTGQHCMSWIDDGVRDWTGLQGYKISLLAKCDILTGGKG